MILYSVLRVPVVLACKLMFGYKVYGEENIPTRGGFILAGNHLSFLDPLLLGAACPRQLNFMARHDLFRNPFFGWLITSVGAFPVKRDSADTSALKEAIRRIKRGNCLVLFPEGSRGGTKASPEPKAGIGFLAQKLGIPIVPARIEGTDIALPRGARCIRPARVSVSFGKQIFVTQGVSYEAIAQQVMDAIRRLAH